jgi:hypothetical protein
MRSVHYPRVYQQYFFSFQKQVFWSYGSSIPRLSQGKLLNNIKGIDQVPRHRSYQR